MRNQIATKYLNIPKGLLIKEYKIVSYLQGNEICKCKGLTLDHFETISFMRKSKSQLKKVEYVHVIGHRTLEKQETILILQPK